MAASALVAVACTGGDDDDTASTTTPPPPTSAPTETTAVTTTEPRPDTTETAPTTERTTAPDTTETTAATTTDPPSTAAPDLDEVEQAVLDAVVEAWRVFNEAKLDPFDDDKVAAMQGVLGGAILENAVEIIGNYRFNNHRSVTNPEYPATVLPNRETVTIDLDNGTASVEYCRVGSNIKVETSGNPDGSDLVIDDTINSYLERSDLTLVDGKWIETGGIQLLKYEGATTCQSPE